MAQPSPSGPKHWNRQDRLALAGVIVAILAIVIPLLWHTSKADSDSNLSTGPIITTIPAGPTTTSPAVIEPPVKPPINTSSTSSPPVAPAEPAPARHGQFTLANGYSVDLDSRSSNWDVRADTCYPEYVCDLNLNGQELWFNTRQGVAAVDSHARTAYSTCANETGYGTVDSQLSTDKTEPGMAFCLLTNAGNYVLLRIIDGQGKNTELGPYLDWIKFDATIWPAN